MVKAMTITRYSNAEFIETEDLIIREHRANIFLNGELYISLMCLPEYFEELAIGFLFSEHIIGSYSDIQEISSTCTGKVFVTTNDKNVDTTKTKKRVVVSGCAQGSVSMSFLNDENLPEATSALKINAKELLKIMADFSKQSPLFQQTGGVHSSSLVLPGGESLFAEDIGRHNAIDKIVGTALKNCICINDAMLLTSGRISSEILIKTAKLGIPALISHSAPTDMAVEIARKTNMTLIGFTRGTKFNIYSGKFRVV